MQNANANSLAAATGSRAPGRARMPAHKQTHNHVNNCKHSRIRMHSAWLKTLV